MRRAPYFFLSTLTTSIFFLESMFAARSALGAKYVGFHKIRNVHAAQLDRHVLRRRYRRRFGTLFPGRQYPQDYAGTKWNMCLVACTGKFLIWKIQLEE